MGRMRGKPQLVRSTFAAHNAYHGGLPPVVPTFLTNPIMALRGDAGSSAAAGAVMPSWTDQSPLGTVWTSPPVPNRPARNSTRQWVDFTGASTQRFENTGSFWTASGIGINQPPLSCMALIYLPTIAAATRYMIWEFGVSPDIVFAVDDRSVLVGSYDGTLTERRIAGTPLAALTNQWLTVWFRSTGTTIELGFNSTVAQFSGAFNKNLTAGAQASAIGTGVATGSPFNGRMAWIVGDRVRWSNTQLSGVYDNFQSYKATL